MSGAEPSSPPASPEPSSTPTSETWRKATKAHGPDEEERWEETEEAGTLTTHGLGLPADTLVGSTSSTEASPARTLASRGSEPGSQAAAPASSLSSPESLTLFDHDGCSSRTYPGSSPRTMVGTSASSFRRWPISGTASRGACSTHATSESPSGAVECSLSAILEETPHSRYALSARAARGVLRRSTVRGRALPSALRAALEDLATPTPEE